MNFRKLFQYKAKAPENNARRMSSGEGRISQAADRALRQYKKTFEDLARYDRGEPVRLPR